MADAHDLSNGTPLYLIDFGPDEWWECVDEGEDGELFKKGRVYETAQKPAQDVWGLRDEHGHVWRDAIDAKFKPAGRPSEKAPTGDKIN